MKSLRIAHIADTHLGYRSGSLFGRDEDFATSWMYACQAIVDSSPDLIIHAGDVFHSARPDWKALTAFTSGLKLLQEANVPIFVIAGNHDTSGINQAHTVFSFTAQLLPNIFITNDWTPTHIVFDDYEIVLVPHRSLLSKTLAEDMLDITSKISEGKRAILVSHGSISKDDNTSELGSIAIPHVITEYPWNYIALGHLHMAQPYGTRGWYSGSTERCGWSDYPANPAWTLVTLESNGSIRHTQQPVPHMPMIQLPEYNCEDRSDDFICDGILESCDQVVIPLERTHLRIKLTQLPAWRKRKIEGFVEKRLRRDNPQVVFRAVVDSEVSLLVDSDNSSAVNALKGIQDLFTDFVDEQNYPDKDFRERFLAKGRELLAQNVDAEYG